MGNIRLLIKLRNLSQIIKDVSVKEKKYIYDFGPGALPQRETRLTNEGLQWRMGIITERQRNGKCWIRGLEKSPGEWLSESVKSVK